MFEASRGMFDGYDKLGKLRGDMKVTFVMAEDSSSRTGENASYRLVTTEIRKLYRQGSRALGHAR